jgi:hypothetical protein
MGADGREAGIRCANGAGEIKASASALAGDFDFTPLTLWRAGALPLCFDGHFYSCLFVLIRGCGENW